MSKKVTKLHRRGFLQCAASMAGAAALAPTIIPSSALGRDGSVAPSERVVVGGIGIGNRGTYDLGCFLEQKDVQFAAVCDIKEVRRLAVKKKVDELYGNSDCTMHRDFRELLDRNDIDAVLIATGPNWHATAAMTTAKAGKDMYCEKSLHQEHRAEPDPGRNDAPDRARLPGGDAATQSAAFRVRLRAGTDRQAWPAQDGLRSSGGNAGHDERMAGAGN
jgi:hypothetical protein